MVCAEMLQYTYTLIMYQTIPVPEVEWEEHEVTIPEGEDREVCFTSNIGTAVPYEVNVGVREKGLNPAARGR